MHIGSKIVYFFSWISFPMIVFGITDIKINPDIITPGTNLTVTFNINQPGDKIYIEFIHDLYNQEENQNPVYKYTAVDEIGSDGFLNGDLNPKPGMISLHFGIPRMNGSNFSPLGNWKIRVTNENGSIDSTNFTVKNYDNSWFDNLANILIGLRGNEKNDWHLWIMDSHDGTNKRSFMNLKYDFYATPAWSPNGKQIAFAAKDKGSSWKILLINDWLITNPDPEILTVNKKNCYCPKWSPKGQKLVFICDGKINIMDIKNKTIEKVFDNIKVNKIIQWSIDDEIIFASDISSSLPLLGTTDVDYFNLNPREIYNSRIMGSSLDIYYKVLITSNSIKAIPFHPNLEWISGLSPDRKRYVLDYMIKDVWDIWTISTQGTNQKNLTHDDYMDHDPSWSPNGKKIIYISNH